MNDFAALMGSAMMDPDKSGVGKALHALFAQFAIEQKGKTPMYYACLAVLDAALKRDDIVWGDMGIMERETSMMMLKTVKAAMTAGE